ncbi:MAG TPA: c-type cytochrome [Solirubrobacteraceae bacterium]|nr:c-type cytochrome [Solirubrobacteraceae bacterium]
MSPRAHRRFMIVGLVAVTALAVAIASGIAFAPSARAHAFTTPTTAITPGTTTHFTTPAHPGPPPGASRATVLADGQSLFNEHCASCHGYDLRGRTNIAPSLRGVGAGPVNFYIATGRMPLNNTGEEPLREPSIFTLSQQRAIEAYVREVGGGPAAPYADPAKGSLSLGFRLFDENCAGCHSIVARGGIAIDALVPNLSQATADQIAEAVRMGPYVMPKFTTFQLDQYDLNSLARYVIWTRTPDNAGGWGIYNIGPVPEGIVAWFVGLFALIIVARLIGERTPA